MVTAQAPLIAARKGGMLGNPGHFMDINPGMLNAPVVGEFPAETRSETGEGLDLNTGMKIPSTSTIGATSYKPIVPSAEIEAAKLRLKNATMDNGLGGLSGRAARITQPSQVTSQPTVAAMPPNMAQQPQVQGYSNPQYQQERLRRYLQEIKDVAEAEKIRNAPAPQQFMRGMPGLQSY